MKINTKTITMLALCISINMIGSMIGVLIKVPVYLDSIGTIMAGFSFGPIFGVITGIVTAFVNTIGDPVALYFMPTQIIVGFTAGYFTFLKRDDFKSKFYVTPVMSIPAAISSSIIATYLFGTVTTAGSSYIVQAIRAVVDFPDFLVVLVIQIITDYADKLLSTLLVSKVYNMNAFQNLIRN